AQDDPDEAARPARRGDRRMSRLRRFGLAVVCAGLVTTACGNTTTREERLAARGIRADAAADAAATTAQPTDGAVPSEAAASSYAPDQAAPVGTGAAAAPNPASLLPGSRPASSTKTEAVAGSSGGGATGPAAAAATAAPGPSRAAASEAGPGAAKPGEPSASAPKPPARRSEMVFGSFGVEAGPLGTISGPAPPAIRAWVADVNSRGGLAGHPVRVIMVDDGGDPARAQSAVRQMVEKDKVVAFLYPYAIGTLVPVLPYLEEKGIPVLGQMGAETLADYSAAVFQPFMAAHKGTAWGFVKAILAQTDKRKLGIFWCREVAACQLVKDGIKKITPFEGVEVVYDTQISFAQPDYTAEVLGAQRAGVEILITFADIATVNRVGQSAHRQSYRPVLSATHNMQHRDVFAYQDTLDGLLSYTRIPPYDSPKMADYRRAMSLYQPKAPLAELGGAGYVMGKLLEVKIAPLLDDDPSPAELTEAMYTLRGETLGGILPPITFPRAKDRSEVNLCVIPVTFKGGKFVTPGETFVCAPGWKPGT
ncbi:MAG TPA: ABC transporter substrate-binding protein, partial [Acidimicrobiia bacterium]|nr:ABC transporter substrate-binding protein [Acidimicrobiia bacterium]